MFKDVDQVSLTTIMNAQSHANEFIQPNAATWPLIIGKNWAFPTLLAMFSRMIHFAGESLPP